MRTRELLGTFEGHCQRHLDIILIVRDNHSQPKKQLSRLITLGNTLWLLFHYLKFYPFSPQLLSLLATHNFPHLLPTSSLTYSHNTQSDRIRAT